MVDSKENIQDDEDVEKKPDYGKVHINELIHYRCKENCYFFFNFSVLNILKCAGIAPYLLHFS